MVRNIHAENSPRIVAAPAQFIETNLAALDHEIIQIVLAKPESLALDLSQVQAVDSGALNWMLSLQSRMNTQQIRFSLASPSMLCESVLTATRLDQRFRVTYPDLAMEGRHA